MSSSHWSSPNFCAILIQKQMLSACWFDKDSSVHKIGFEHIAHISVKITFHPTCTLSPFSSAFTRSALNYHLNCFSAHQFFFTLLLIRPAKSPDLGRRLPAFSLHCRLSGFDVYFTGEIENLLTFFFQIEYFINYGNQI